MIKINIQKLLLFVILSITLSCNHDDSKGEAIENIMNVNINGESFRVINENVGGNENCDKLRVSTFYRDNNKIQFRLYFDISVTGELLRVWYDEYRLPHQGSFQNLDIFLTPNFNPKKTFEISDFYYDKDTGHLSFSFNGTVFWEINNTELRDISGDVYIKNFRTIDCSIAKFGMSYFSENISLYSHHPNSTRFSDGKQHHSFVSNNGFILGLRIEEDLWNMPIGSIDFNENSNTNYITLLEQTGDIIVANQLPSLSQFEWISYSTNGQINITEKIIENGYKKIRGNITMNAMLNNQVVYSFENIEFSTGSFVN